MNTILKTLAIFTFLSTSLSVSVQASTIAGDTLKVLTFNLFGMPDSGWPTRIGQILDEAEDLQPDLIALQEVIEPGGSLELRAKEIADSLFNRTGIGYDFVYERTHFSWSTWFEGVGILSRHVILDSEARALPPGLFPRAVVWARVLTGAGIVNFFSTHLSFSNQEPQRLQQVQAIKNFVTEKSADSLAIANIVCGDFNAIPDSPPIQLMTTLDNEGVQFIDSWAKANPGQPGLTIPSDNPNARIDYIFVKGEEKASVLNSKLAFTQPNANELYPSDHIGVFSTLLTDIHKFEINLLSPSAGEEVSGETSISWTIDPELESVTTRIFISDDAGKTWRVLFTGELPANSFSWNTLQTSDGTQNIIRVAASGDTSFGLAQSDIFTVNNPGNSAPELQLQSPQGGDLLQGVHLIRWNASDADGDALLLSLELSSNSGLTWQELATNEPNDGSFSWNTEKYANSLFYKLRITASDSTVETIETSNIFEIRNERGDFPESRFEHLEGQGNGFIKGSVIDSTLLTNHFYRVTFDDTSSEQKKYDVFDLDENEFVLQAAAEMDGTTEGPAFDGLRLIIFDYKNAAVNSDSTGWTVGASTLNFSISTPTVFIDGQQVQSVPYPADYKITIADEVIDTTSTAFGFAPKPVKFSVWNLTKNRKNDILFTEFDNNQTITDLDKVTILEPDENGDLLLSWALFFSGARNHIPPVPGDEFRLKTFKPFTGNDVFQFKGSLLPTSVAGKSTSGLPRNFELFSNYPNPFNPSTTMSYYLPKAAQVKLSVYNLLGQKIETLVNKKQPAGKHFINWDGKNYAGQAVSSGLYIYRVEAGNISRSEKMVLLK